MPGIDASSAALLIRALTNRAIQERGKYDDTNRAISQGAQGVSDVLLRNQARDEELADQQTEMDFTLERDKARRAEELADQRFTTQRDETRNKAIADRAVQADKRDQAAQQLDRRASWDAAFPGSVAAPEIGDTGPSLSPVAGTPLPQNAPPAPYDPYGIPNRPDHLPPSSAVDALVAQRQDEIAAFEEQQEALAEAQQKRLEAHVLAPVALDDGSWAMPPGADVVARWRQATGQPDAPLPIDLVNKYQDMVANFVKNKKAQAGEEPAETPEARLKRLETESAARARGTATGRGVDPARSGSMTEQDQAQERYYRQLMDRVEKQVELLQGELEWETDEAKKGETRTKLAGLQTEWDDYNAKRRALIGLGGLGAAQPTGQDVSTSDLSPEELAEYNSFTSPEAKAEYLKGLRGE